MKLIKQNPFRILGIPVNASAKDLAANKGRMRLLDIGKEVSFPLDLSGLLPTINRTKEAVASAERDINLPQDKIKYALFWFAQPTEPIGKLAYDHLLQGNVEKARELFSKCHSWEALLCRAVLELQAERYGDAMLDFYSITTDQSSQLCQAIVGQTFEMSASDLIKLYIKSLTEEVDASTLLHEWGKDTALPGGSEIIEFELRNIAIEKPLDTIEKEIATCKAISTDDAEAQLEAGKKLANNTHKVRIQLQKMVGSDDPRYSRMADKLANQILQCSINYFNNIDGENREIIENALKLGEYALKMAVGKMARDHIQHNVDILRKKKANLPPSEVEIEVNAIFDALKTFIEQPDKIEHSVTLLNSTKPQLLSIRTKLGNTNEFYLKLSTQIVNNALHNLIEEVNQAQKEKPYEGQTEKVLRLLLLEKIVSDAWNCTKIMDTFDMESEFRTNRYNPNRNSLQNMYDQLSRLSAIPTKSTYSSSSSSSSSGGCYIATMVYGDYDHPQVMVLRDFRDNVLQQNPIGRAFVKFYYRYSPTWVEHLKDKKQINNFIRRILDGFIKIYKNEK